MKDLFEVLSLKAYGSEADFDMGVVRVPGCHLGDLGGRNALVKISVIKDGRKEKSLIRIARAATGKSALKKSQVALQYDDQCALGIRDAGITHKVMIERVNEWLFLPFFLLSHTSPLVRRDAAFSLVLFAAGAVIGLATGLAL